jgi:hydrogenase maturation protease
VSAPLLVFGWGNASRGDDALGPLLVQQLQATLARDAAVDCMDDYQLQPEHALDLVGRQRVLFVDASRSCGLPFEVCAVQPAPDHSLSSHALSPQALLQVYRQLQGAEPPPCSMLAIRGLGFELGQPLSQAARGHLQAALAWAHRWVAAGGG